MPVSVYVSEKGKNRYNTAKSAAIQAAKQRLQQVETVGPPFLHQLPASLRCALQPGNLVTVLKSAVLPSPCVTSS